MSNAMIARTMATITRMFRMPSDLPTPGEANKLLGEQVFVTLDNGDDTHLATIVKGKLLAWSDQGEVVVEDASGDVLHCWPMLKVSKCAPPA